MTRDIERPVSVDSHRLKNVLESIFKLCASGDRQFSILV